MLRIVRFLIALTGVSTVLAVAAGTALAGGDYNTPGGAVAGEQTGGGGTLPFTGSELLLYVIVGVAIVATGFALRAAAHRRAS